MDELSRENVVATISTLVDIVIEHEAACRASKAADPLAQVSDHPHAYLLANGISHLGQVIAADGGFALMQEISNRVEALPKYAGTSRPAVIIDRAWRGVGEWYA